MDSNTNRPLICFSSIPDTWLGLWWENSEELHSQLWGDFQPFSSFLPHAGLLAGPRSTMHESRMYSPHCSLEHVFCLQPLQHVWSKGHLDYKMTGWEQSQRFTASKCHGLWLGKGHGREIFGARNNEARAFEGFLPLAQPCKRMWRMMGKVSLG